MQRLVPTANSRLIKNVVLSCSRRNLAFSSAVSSIQYDKSRRITSNGSLVTNERNLLGTNKLSHGYDLKSGFQFSKRFYANLPRHTKIGLPALSPTMEQGTIAKWVKQEGDQIMEGDLIAEIETDKATMGLEASEDGYLAKILVAEKTKDIPLKTLLCIVVPDKESIGAFANFTADMAQDSSSSSAAPSKPAETAAESKPAPAAKQTPPPPPPPPSQTAPTPAPAQTSSTPASSGGRVFATPLARKIAAERNIDLSLVSASGPNNQIRAEDVLKYTVKTPTVPSPASTSSQQFDDVQLNNFRSVTAKRLLQSKQTIPHYYLTVDFELDNALKVRQDLNEQLVKDNMKISVTDLVIKAAAMSCKKVPEVNSSWMDTFIRKYNNVDINVAVATDNGLITPIVFNADKKGLTSISFDVTSLAEKARNNKLQPNEFQGGTFTVSNLGMFGIKSFTAIINPPQAAILAVGGSEKRVVPDGKGGHRVATFMTVSLSCDHRVIDGAVGAKWLDHFKKFMENPASMLL